MPTTIPEELERRARRLHEESIVINALDCTPLPQADEVYLGKLVASGVTAVNHAVSISEGLEETLKSIATWRRWYAAHSDRLLLGSTPADIDDAKSSGRVAVFLGTEDSAPLRDDVWALEVLYLLGIRFWGLTYQRRNLAGDGCGEPANAGLSAFGRAVIDECGRLGIVLDLSHTGQRSTLEAIEHSRAPVLISHAGLRHFVDSRRNKGDDEIRALAAKGGVIGIAAKSGFLSATGLVGGTDVGTYVDTIAYVADLVGIDHVAVGTDVGDERKYTREGMARVRQKYPEIPIVGEDLNMETIHPRGLASPADLPNVTREMVVRGFSPEDTRKVIGGNMLRLMRAVLHAD